MSQHHERRRRRRNNGTADQAQQLQQPPLVPDLIDIGSQYSNTQLQSNDEEDDHVWSGILQARRVRIVVPSSSIIPPPPEEPPPMPSEMMKVVVLGGQESGKTSLVRRFVHRTTASSSKNSGSRHSTRRTAGAITTTTIDYYKKDIAFWKNRDTSICVRLQLWDVGVSKTQPAEVLQLLQRTQVVILVISLDQGPAHALTETRNWKQWLVEMYGTHDENSNRTPPIYWFLHKSDVIPAQNSLAMIQLGAIIADTSRELCFADWFLTSCEVDNGSSVEAAIMKVIRSNCLDDRAPQLILSATSSFASSSSSPLNKTVSNNKLRSASEIGISHK